MEYRKYRDTGLKTSLLGFGCMRFPMLEDGKTIDTATAERMVDLAYANGVNYFDTAYVYNNGDSERTIGAILKKYPRDSYFLTSKMPNFLCKTPEDVERIFNESLERCGVDYFDFYLCHNINGGNIDLYAGENFILPYLEKMKAEGKIRYLGFSSHGSPDDLRRAVAIRDWDFVQIQFNYLDWTYQDAKQQYEILEQAGLPVMVMEPVRGGRLASLGDHGKALEDYAPGKSAASWALRWAATHPAIQVVLSGMSTMEQVEDNLKTFKAFQPMTDEENEILAKTAHGILNDALIPCTGCRYCSECPLELDIPKMLKIYGDYLLSHSFFSLSGLRGLEPGKGPSDCLGCGTCESRCPQNIEVPRLLAELAELQSKMPGQRR